VTATSPTASCPAIPSDLIHAGTVIVLNNSITSTNLSAIDFDGRDKIAATKSVAVTKTGWASGSNTLLAGSVEVFDTGLWGTDYRAPVGANIADATDHQMFEYTSLPSSPVRGATVQIDADANGTFETTVNLRGQSRRERRRERRRPRRLEQAGAGRHPDRRHRLELREPRLAPCRRPWSTALYTPVSTAATAQGGRHRDDRVAVQPARGTHRRIHDRDGRGLTTTPSPCRRRRGGVLAQVIRRLRRASPRRRLTFSTTNSTDPAPAAISLGLGLHLVRERAHVPGAGRARHRRDPTSGVNPLEDGNPSGDAGR
jgi:hypothetical protein